MSEFLIPYLKPDEVPPQDQTMKATFNAVPGQDELQQIDRDLQFYPSTVTNPQSLTVDQVAKFNSDG